MERKHTLRIVLGFFKQLIHSRSSDPGLFCYLCRANSSGMKCDYFFSVNCPFPTKFYTFLICSRIFFPGVHFATWLGGMIICSSGFFGFLPIFSFLSTTSKMPKSRNSRRYPSVKYSSPYLKKPG